MFVTYRGSFLRILGWQWKSVTLFTAAGAAAVGAHLWAGDLVVLPSFPLAVVGAAIGIFASFRTNSAYDRWWEGRKLWGSLVNTSRHFTTQVLAYLPRAASGAPSALQRRLVERMIAYVHVLRATLRGQDALTDPDVQTFLDAEEREAIKGQSNLNHAILQMQLEALTGEANADRLAPFRLSDLDASVRQLLDIQGGCERIKKTPFPRGYTFVTDRLIMTYSLLLPFGMVGELGWGTIPLSVLVCLSFLLISEAGRVLEDPFTMYWPALPLSALSKTIEINLRERLGDRDVPPLPTPNTRGILM